MQVGKKGFTLIETLIGVVILGIVASLITYSFADATEESEGKVRAAMVEEVEGYLEMATRLGYREYFQANFVGTSGTIVSADGGAGFVFLDNTTLAGVDSFPRWVENEHGIEIRPLAYTMPGGVIVVEGQVTVDALNYLLNGTIDVRPYNP